MKRFSNTEKLVTLSIKYERILRFFVKLWIREISVIAIHIKEARQDVVRKEWHGDSQNWPVRRFPILQMGNGWQIKYFLAFSSNRIFKAGTNSQKCSLCILFRSIWILEIKWAYCDLSKTARYPVCLIVLKKTWANCQR